MSDASSFIPWGGLALAAATLVAWRLRRPRALPLLAPVDRELSTLGPVLELFTSSAPASRRANGGALLEVAGDSGAHVIVALADSAVSLYVRGGPSVHGAARIPQVLAAAVAFRAAVASHLREFGPESDVRPPEPGWAVIRTRTDDGGVSLRVRLDGPIDHYTGTEVLRAGLALQQALLAHVR